MQQKELRIYCTRWGRKPFLKWLDKLRDRLAKSHIQARLDRLILGHYGDYKHVGCGVYELRIHLNSGYRVYFAEKEQHIILLLLGGNKASQQADILQAIHYWQDFQERYHE